MYFNGKHRKDNVAAWEQLLVGKLFTPHFVDDQVILTEDEFDIDYMLRKLKEQSELTIDLENLTL